MRGETNRAKIDAFMNALAERVRGAGRICFTGGGTAVLYGWRATTIAQIKEIIDLNIELAAPDDFIPPLPGWEERSIFIARRGEIDFYHYDLYAQALAKIERGHARDLADARAMLARGLITCQRLLELFAAIEPALIRYPAVDPMALRSAVVAFVDERGMS